MTFEWAVVEDNRASGFAEAGEARGEKVAFLEIENGHVKKIRTKDGNHSEVFIWIHIVSNSGSLELQDNHMYIFGLRSWIAI